MRIFQKILKKKMNIYLDGLLSTIKTDGKYQYLNGIKCPKNLKTDHYKFEIGSDNYKKNLIELFFLLHLFHLFAEKHNLLYSITAGSLLGYYRNGHIMLWDDDIDLLLSKDFSKFINNLWKNSGKSYPIYGDNWRYKKIKLLSYNVILLNRNDSSTWFKIKLNTRNFKGDIGGVDLFLYPNPMNGFAPLAKNIINKRVDNVDKYPFIEYGPVKTRALNKELATILLDGHQNFSNWKKMIHPSLL